MVAIAAMAEGVQMPDRLDGAGAVVGGDEARAATGDVVVDGDAGQAGLDELAQRGTVVVDAHDDDAVEAGNGGPSPGMLCVPCRGPRRR